MKGEINLPKGRKSQASRHDDRTHEANGPVITYQLSEEELAKYRDMPKPGNKNKVGVIPQSMGRGRKR